MIRIEMVIEVSVIPYLPLRYFQGIQKTNKRIRLNLYLMTNHKITTLQRILSLTESI